MSHISLESLVRELQKTVFTLVNKIDSLESRINEQSVIISKLAPQSEKGDTHKLTILAPCNTIPATAVDSQRPVRRAHVNASLAIAESSNAGKKRRNGRATSTVMPETNNRLDTVVLVNSKTTRDKMIADDELTESKPSTTPRETSKPDDEDAGLWQVVGQNNKSRKLQRPVTVGTGNASNELQAAVRIKYIQAWSFKPDTTAGQILKFLNNIVVSQYTVEKRTIRSELHASFVIGMPECVFEKVTTPTAWPPRVHFSDWFPARPRLQRGSERTDSST
ncbi:Uncharacterized protein OBRU01_11889 [Operophtera brumata]|uniref:Uncharacterized protein n=1 Tax=Operophtera brumata TaxID=104452 RepID=A0A0L7LB64_OPEBR|nr:Uncharacterized protein OBRU01_11889 [Operophtera brumata]